MFSTMQSARKPRFALRRRLQGWVNPDCGLKTPGERLALCLDGKSGALENHDGLSATQKPCIQEFGTGYLHWIAGRFSRTPASSGFILARSAARTPSKMPTTVRLGIRARFVSIGGTRTVISSCQRAWLGIDGLWFGRPRLAAVQGRDREQCGDRRKRTQDRAVPEHDRAVPDRFPKPGLACPFRLTAWRNGHRRTFFRALQPRGQ